MFKTISLYIHDYREFPDLVLEFLIFMYFLKILTELEYSGVGRNKEQSACMLGHLVSNAPRLIRPYMEPIPQGLCDKLLTAYTVH